MERADISTRVGVTSTDETLSKINGIRAVVAGGEARRAALQVWDR